ncbi:hypothetical protein AC1031_009662 [Aphanomyces cochlioides]|nr:hypothetical protein AC1031_009662 [Aphanomyces cochlioides]
MAKVHVIRGHEREVRVNRWSVTYNVLFVLNLTATLNLLSTLEWKSFQEYTEVMTLFFQRLHNNDTTVCRHDTTSNTFAARFMLALPYAVPQNHVENYLLRLPGSAYYGAGAEAYMSSFLVSNARSRASMKPWRVCEHYYLVGILFGELCFWVDEVDSGSDNSISPRYNVSAAIYSWETPQLCWFKFIFRSLVTAYVLFVLWTCYYRHFGILLLNLDIIGLASGIAGYQVVLGDPGYTVLSDPFVSTVIILLICAAAHRTWRSLSCELVKSKTCGLIHSVA